MSVKKKKPIDHHESVLLNRVVLMAQQSLDPEHYGMFCKVHDCLVENRNLQNEKLN